MIRSSVVFGSSCFFGRARVAEVQASREREGDHLRGIDRATATERDQHVGLRRGGRPGGRRDSRCRRVLRDRDKRGRQARPTTRCRRSRTRS